MLSNVQGGSIKGPWGTCPHVHYQILYFNINFEVLDYNIILNLASFYLIFAFVVVVACSCVTSDPNFTISPLLQEDLSSNMKGLFRV